MSDADTKSAIERWPIFICYRQVDGTRAATRLHDLLHGQITAGPDNRHIEFDVYLDELMPGVENWRKLHRPYLEKSRALIVVCTPGARLDEGPSDWVHREIEWWLKHRQVAPILIDPLSQGVRYIPEQIHAKWPDIQRISLLESEWSSLEGAELSQKAVALQKKIVGAILPSGAKIYAEELDKERLRARRTGIALVASLVLLVAAILFGVLANHNLKVAEALNWDGQAARLFEQGRLLDLSSAEKLRRQDDLVNAISASDPGTVRRKNLQYELAQLNADLVVERNDRDAALVNAREMLDKGDAAWASLADSTWGPSVPVRTRPVSPYVFSIELLNAGYGEAILVHYGTPDDTKILMINAGPGRSFDVVKSRLEELSAARFDGRPVPIELFILGDRDEPKIGGLQKLLENVANIEEPNMPLVNFRGIWANIFQVEGDPAASRLRPTVRRMIDELEIPLNAPFKSFVVRPDVGIRSLRLLGELEVVVLGPTRKQLTDLHRDVSHQVFKNGGSIEPMNMTIPQSQEFANNTLLAPDPQATLALASTPCRPSVNAKQDAVAQYRDPSVANAASIVILLKFRDRTFLFTGDSRGDFVLQALYDAGLLPSSGRGYVDLLSLPHFGSENNVTTEFFERVQSAGYLLSGDGRHDNPAIETIASLISARQCERFTMYFVNRDGADETRRPHGARLDQFFVDEAPFEPNYQRVFRSTVRGSVVIDLMEPIR